MDKVNLLDKIREVMQPMTNISGLDINSFKYRTVKDQIDDSFGWFIDMQLERDLITQDHLSQGFKKERRNVLIRLVRN